MSGVHFRTASSKLHKTSGHKDVRTTIIYVYFEPSLRLGVEEDELGLDSAKKIMERAVELAKLVKKDTDS